MLYDIAKRKILTADLTSGLSIMLVSDAYIFDAGHEGLADVDGEFEDPNYAREPLNSVEIEGTETGFALKHANVTWPKMSGIVGGAVVFFDEGLLSYHPFVPVQLLESDRFEIKLETEGILEVSE